MPIIVGSFVFFLLCFIVIGIWSSKDASSTSRDYLLAGRQVSPWLAGLSAVASTCSGFVFIGLMGATYRLGVSIFWLALGLALGNAFCWVFLFKNFFLKSVEHDVKTIPEFLCIANKDQTPKIRMLSAVLIVIFLGTYASAQLNAGSKALQVLLDLRFETGAIIGSIMIGIYCFSGGIRASIWTDAAQAIVMVAAMAAIVGICLYEIGGWSQLVSKLRNIDPKLASYNPTSQASVLLFTGSLFLGIGIIGQPHVMIRAMTIESEKALRKTRKIFFIYYTIFLALSVTAGLCCRAFLDQNQNFDPELALPTLAMDMLPEALIGLVLAGIFASTISTADSQVLSCSAAITEDLKLFGDRPQYWKHRVATASITASVLGIALLAPRSVFSLVLTAWSALASSIGPLVILKSLGRPTSENQGLAMMICGLTTASIFRFSSLGAHINETLPGMSAAFLAYLLWPKKQQNEGIRKTDI